MTHYAIWPEGQPEKAYATTSWWGSRWNLMKRQTAMLLDIHNARRMRMSVCEEGPPIPSVVEAALEDAGAIAPRDGWPKRPDLAKLIGDKGAVGDVFTRTFSVV